MIPSGDRIGFGAALRDIAAGTLITGFGLFVVIKASNYGISGPTGFGAGLFPVALGFLLILLGIAVALFERVGEPLADVGTMAREARSGLALLTSVALFAALIEQAGLIATVFVVVLVSAVIGARMRLLPACGLALGVAILNSIVFVFALDLPLSVFPDWP